MADEAEGVRERATRIAGEGRVTARADRAVRDD